jgi:hypothetical protein
MQEMNGESTITITPLVVPDAVVIIVMMIGVSLTILTQWPFQKNDNKQPFLFDCEWLMFFFIFCCHFDECWHCGGWHDCFMMMIDVVMVVVLIIIIIIIIIIMMQRTIIAIVFLMLFIMMATLVPVLPTTFSSLFHTSLLYCPTTRCALRLI